MKDSLASLVSGRGYPVRGKDRDSMDQVERTPLGPGIMVRLANSIAASGKGCLATLDDVDQFIQWLDGDLPQVGTIATPGQTGFFDDEEQSVD